MSKFSILNGAKYFFKKVLQNYLVFISVKQRTKQFSVATRINLLKTHAKSEENIENITKSDGNVASSFADYDVLPDIIFHGNCLINNNNVYLSKKKSK